MDAQRPNRGEREEGCRRVFKRMMRYTREERVHLREKEGDREKGSEREK